MSKEKETDKAVEKENSMADSYAEDLKRAVCIDGPQSTVEEELKTALGWREIKAGIKTGRLCTGIMSGIVKKETEISAATVSYKGYQVYIKPELMFSEQVANRLKEDHRLLRNRLTLMLGAEIDFVITDVDDESKTIIGNRRLALYKKAELFYFTPGVRQITEGRVAEAHIVSVGFHSVRVEVFGVETEIGYSDLSWEWTPDLKKKHSVFDRIFVRVRQITGDTPKTLQIKCEAKSVQENPDIENLDRCLLQSRYIGTVVNLRRGSIAVRLSIGVNAIATGCMTENLPARGDTVCFLVTSVDEYEVIARGVLTRIIKKSTSAQ